MTEFTSIATKVLDEDEAAAKAEALARDEIPSWPTLRPPTRTATLH